MAGIEPIGLSNLDIAIVVQLSFTLADHLAKDVGGCLAILSLLFDGFKLLEEFIKSVDLLLHGNLSNGFFGFLIRNLSCGPSAFNAGLEHINAVALLSCRVKEKRLVNVENVM